VSLYTKIKKGEEAISIVGLGYVGLPMLSLILLPARII
jgi:UDP-N-acetyl-D-mannosaminuronate dehydrogenase